MPKISCSVKQCRDLTLLTMPDGSLLVTACDSLGGIGPKAQDQVSTAGYVVGRFASRVPLMEVMAAGAKPQVLINTLCVEMSPTGKEILKGIRDEIRAGELDIPVVTGSTEENVATCQTGVGVTVIGLVTPEGQLRAGSAAQDDLVICIGKPKVGPEVDLADEELADLSTLHHILQLDYVNDILPVGSKGIAYEAKLLANTAGLTLELGTDLSTGLSLDLAKSAGPATCLLCSLPPDSWLDFRQQVHKPLTVVGRLR